jgi:TrmH family RNA methyltransferase
MGVCCISATKAFNTASERPNTMNQVQLIQSRQNKTIKEIIKLRDKKQRRKQKRFTVEGFRFIQEALVSGVDVTGICFSSDVANKVHKELADLLQPGIQLFEMPPELFHQIAETESPQGILAVAKMPEHSLDTAYRKGFRGLLINNIQDPGNVGTMIRSAHALGFDAVAITKGSADTFNSKVLRSTMGSVFHIPVIDNLDETEVFTFCREKNLRLIAACLEQAVPCHEVELTSDIFLVIGNEGKGVSEAILDSAALKVFIPMPGRAESFNAGVAASILMYESNRQRR